MTAAQYNTHRNKVNNRLRTHYKRQYQHPVVKMHDMHLKDGVHLNHKSYEYLTNVIANHIKKINPSKHIMGLQVGHHKNPVNKEEIIVDIIKEEKLIKTKNKNKA